ncbi:MAG: hypothetical protein ACKVS8_01660 [Phycisphaerales bacterium]
MLLFAPPSNSALAALLDLLPARQPALMKETPAGGPLSPSLTADPRREHAIDAIIAMNPTATRAYLDQFHSLALDHYRSHLDASREPRGKDARWVRRTNVPAVEVMSV